MNFNQQLTESQLTPFEKAQDNADFFTASCLILGSVQNILAVWKQNLGAHKILDWRNDNEDRATLKEVMKDQRNLSDALVEAANKFEKILGISA